MASGPFVQVAFPLPLNRTFDYHVTQGIPGPAQDHLMGRRVLVSFGKKKKIGYVVGLTHEAPPFRTKPILAWLDQETLFDHSLFKMAEWLARTYLCSLGEAMACIVPTQLAAPKRLKKAMSNEPPHPAPSPSRGEGGGGGGRSSSLVAHGSLLPLSADQKRVLIPLLAAADSQEFHPFLVRGITDSGKTELYVRAMDRVLEQGRQALFLLPEIALTPPFIERLIRHYTSERVGIWHSGLAAGKRYQTWQRVKAGEIRVLLGARSAIFAPFPRLGAIILDEEHEPTYKQEDRPRYHTRDVALWRAQDAKAIVIMGSATPSLESYSKAKQGVYTLLELTSRVEQRKLPPVTLIDRRPKAVSPPPFSIFSEPLHWAIEQRLARREQAMLFVNRRGFVPFLRCSACGWVARCSRCSTTLVLHWKEERTTSSTPAPRFPVPADSLLRCHACSRAEKVPLQCPSCQGLRLHQYGIGTQRVEAEIKRLFPFVKLARLDRDLGGKRTIYEQVYQAFAQKKLDILIGTQLIAKGFDFPAVTLVGVVDADVSLHLPDFRSAERTFQLIAQVAGRTGRGDAGGKVLVQTHHPEHYALQAAQDHDYVRFYEEEMKYREALRYPPFCRLIHILVRSNREPLAQEAAESLSNQLQTLAKSLSEVNILGPAPAPYSRLRGQFRYQIVLKGTDASFIPFVEFLRHYRNPKAYVSVDIDPMDLL